MKKLFTTLLALCAGFSTYAQFGISDSVSLGAGYANEVYYNTQTMVKTYVSKNNWELGFENNLMEGGIIANHNYGVTIYQCPTATVSSFATVDTTGIATWPKLYNSDTTWSYGALNANRVTTDPFDFGWGNYDFVSHYVLGDDSVFVIKLVTGPPGPGQITEYRKLYILQKTFGGDYYFRYANIDNTNDVTDTIFRSDYTGKNYGYYSLRNNASLDREPVSTDWDILFTRYYGVVPTLGYYPLTGVLSNVGVQIAQASGVDLYTVNAANYASTYVTNISEIGSDWKAFNQATQTYTIEDSLCYFIKAQNNNITRIVFTDFGGSANGNMFFQVNSITTAINEVANAQLNSIALYPNVASQNSTLIFSSNINNNYVLNIYSINGQQVLHQNFTAGAGLNQKQIDVTNFKKGMYIVKLNTGAEELTQKLIVQ